MITIKGVNGFEANLDPEKISAFGLDAPIEPKLWIMYDGKEYQTSLDIQAQYEQVRVAVKGANANRVSRSISGLSPKGER